MHMRSIRNMILAAGVCWAAGGGAATVRAEVSASLHASVSQVAGGSAFDVAIQLELAEGEYLYWENPGEKGKPPSVAWTLPEGFAASPVRFPAPRRLEDGGARVNVIDGAPLLVATISPPAELAPGTTVELAADVGWVIGGAQAAEGSRRVALSLPVADAPAPAGDDDAFLFRLTKRTHPVATAQATNIRLSASVSQATVTVGDAFDVILDVKVKSGWHTQSNKPLGEFFVPMTVFPRLEAGVAYGEPVWPEPHLREDKHFGKVSEFAGEFKVRVPVKVAGPTVAADVKLSGLLSYQACNEQGQCHPPESVEWAVEVKSQSVRAAGAAAPEALVTNAGATTGSGGEAGTSAEAPSGDSAAAEAPASPARVTASPIAQPAGLARLGLLGAIIGGFLGGLILNIMPCVLPVISIKVLSFVQQAGDDPKRVLRLGLTFAAGIIVSFLIIAAAILALQASTRQTQSWGTLFMQPKFLFAMIVVVYVFALNLFGVFEVMLPGAATGRLSAATEREGYTGAFMKGVLATLLATPCSAPFLGSAISFGLAGSRLTVAAVFTAAGLGMAFPYILLTARPAWMKYLPKPGNWMIAFKQFMGFLLVGTAVWLLRILGLSHGAEAVICTLAFLAFVGLACWIFGKIEFNWSASRKRLGYIGALATIALGGWFSHWMYFSTSPVQWVAFEPGLPQKLAAEGRTVYVDYTAAWCLTCQVNKGVVFASKDVLRKFDAFGVVPVKADYTRYDPTIADDLRNFQRDSVPLNVVYPAGKPDAPIVLPTVLTPGLVLDALTEAGPSQGVEKVRPVATAVR